MNNKRYAKYHFSRLIFLLPVMAVIFVIFSNSMVSSWSWYTDADFSGLAFIFFCFAIAIPYAEFREFNNKRNLDTIYSLPISRKSLFLVHYITGIVDFALAYLVAVVICLSKIGHYKLDVGYSIQYFLLELAFIIALYSFITLAVVVGNSNRDSVMLIAMYVCCPLYILYSLRWFIGSLIRMDDWDIYDGAGISKYFNFSPSLVSSNLARAFSGSVSYDPITKVNYFGYVIFIIIGIASAVGSYFVFTHKKAEKTDEVTTSLLGFTTLIPATAIASFLLTYLGGRQIECFVGRIVAVVITYIAYIIHQRTPKISKSSLIILGILGVLAFIPIQIR